MKKKSQATHNIRLFAVFWHKTALHLVRTFENVFKYRFVLLEYDCGHIEIALELVQFVAHFHGQAGHFGPVLHFVEESHKTTNKNVESKI